MQSHKSKMIEAPNDYASKQELAWRWPINGKHHNKKKVSKVVKRAASKIAKASRKRNRS